MPETGVVKWFNPKKGFGFITPSGGASDVFVHYTAINAAEGAFKTLNQGDEVTFEVADGRKGKEAHDVVVTKAAPRQPRPRGRHPMGDSNREEGNEDDMDSEDDEDQE
ncbi:MAG: cold-shock DNA-binding domain-containing protein [Promethearchaeota archaeon CR_4]|nr:MAG: cold-shock DNA-binding domain-containing protein [Candidatus Lokiarchaeota archaeon CR_4]